MAVQGHDHCGETQGWSLNPGRCVGVTERGLDDFIFAERLEELSEELEVLNGKGIGRENCKQCLRLAQGERVMAGTICRVRRAHPTLASEARVPRSTSQATDRHLR